jgi:hypothetical protein
VACGLMDTMKPPSFMVMYRCPLGELAQSRIVALEAFDTKGKLINGRFGIAQ